MDDEMIQVFMMLQELMRKGDEDKAAGKSKGMSASCRLLDDGGSGVHMEVPGKFYTAEAEYKEQAVGQVWWQYCQDKINATLEAFSEGSGTWVKLEAGQCNTH